LVDAWTEEIGPACDVISCAIAEFWLVNSAASASVTAESDDVTVTDAVVVRFELITTVTVKDVESKPLLTKIVMMIVRICAAVTPVVTETAKVRVPLLGGGALEGIQLWRYLLVRVLPLTVDC